jgi:HPt (histidine-containing phosphotransfer) domain-containing protein
MIEPSTSCAGVRPSLPDAAKLDPAALARLSELDPDGRGALVSRVLTAYLGSLSALRDELRAARTVGQHDVVRRVAHTLKSSSASIGASQFVALCARAEAAVRAGAHHELPHLLDELDNESQRVERAVKAALSF